MFVLNLYANVLFSDLNQLKKVIKDKKLDGQCLSVYDIPKIKSIVVSSDKDLEKTEAVMLYFERSQVGGALASDYVKQTEEGYLILEFEEESSKC